MLALILSETMSIEHSKTLQRMPKLVFNSEPCRKFSEEVHQLIRDETSRLDTIDKKVKDMYTKLDDLNAMANDLNKQFHKTAQTYMDRRRAAIIFGHKTFQDPLLDHNLRFDDTKLLCRYIRYFFFVILKMIHQKHDRFNGITTLTDLHQLRTNDSLLRESYDKIAKRLDIDNSGTPGTCVFLLHAFLTDFCTITRYDYTQLMRRKMSLTTSSTEEIQPVVPKAKSLSSKEMTNFALSRVQATVRDPKLRLAFYACVRGVYHIRTDKDL